MALPKNKMEKYANKEKTMDAFQSVKNDIASLDDYIDMVADNVDVLKAQLGHQRKTNTVLKNILMTVLDKKDLNKTMMYSSKTQKETEMSVAEVLERLK